MLKLFLFFVVVFLSHQLQSCRNKNTYEDFSSDSAISDIISKSEYELDEELNYKSSKVKNKPYIFGSIALIPYTFQNLDGWNDAEYNFLLAKKTVLQMCNLVQKRNSIQFKNQLFHLGTAQDYFLLCSLLSKLKHDEDIKFFFEKNFTSLKNNSYDGTFTGYYRIELDASKKRTSKYKYPIYKRPSNLKNGEEYYTREQISRGALSGRGLEIVWLSDIIDAYLLHIQGTGIAKLKNGEKIYLSFDGKNGHEYSSVATYARDIGVMNNLGGLSFYDWVRKNPKKGQKVLNANKSYVFFKQSDEPSVFGSSGIKLIPQASLAVDPSYIPYGAILWLTTKSTPYKSGGIKSMFVAADTGADIKGPIRGDIYFGSGEEADYKAHHTKVAGNYYILIPNKSITMKRILE